MGDGKKSMSLLSCQGLSRKEEGLKLVKVL